LPLPWSSGWLVFGAVMGILCLVRRNGADTFERAAAMALFAQCLCVLSFFALAQRYAADLCPFLIFCLIVFLSSGGVALLRLRHVTIALIAFVVTVNSLVNVSWLVDSDLNVHQQTKAAYDQFQRRPSIHS